MRISNKIFSKEQAAMLALSVVAAACLLTGCSSTAAGTGTSPLSTSTAPMVVTASDAPLSNILSAVVTLSSVSLGTGTSSATVISQPVTVELSGLGAVQEPLELTNVAYGTYNSVSLTVASAVVSYVNSGGQVVSATATLSSPTVTVALSPALTINASGEAQLQMAFNLAQSFSITGSAVTFTPAINTTGALVSAENSGDRQMEVTGSLVSISATSITLQAGDSGKQFSFTINSTTQFPSGVTASSIQAGTIVQVQAQAQSDGTLLATTITPESQDNGSGQQEDGAKGIVTSVTQSGGTLTGFTMAPRESYGAMGNTAATLSVSVSSSTTFNLPEDAQQAGVGASAFTSAEVFPGQSVVVAGTAGTGGVLQAQQVTLAAESVAGTLAAAPQGTSPNFTFALTLPTSSLLTTYTSLTSLNVDTNTNTEFGQSLSASSFASLAANASVEVHGYLIQSGGNYLLYATSVAQVETPETPEAPESPGGSGGSSSGSGN